MRLISIIHLFILLGLITLIGCVGKNTINLRYNYADINVYHCSKSVSIVTLEDKRTNKSIGNNSKGKLFYAKTDVAEWISRALYEELKKAGCSAEYHDKIYEFNTQYVITGSFEQAYIKQKSLTEYEANIRIRLEIARDGEDPLKKKFFITKTKKTLPSPGVNHKMMMQLLQGAMMEIVPQLCDRFKKDS